MAIPRANRITFYFESTVSLNGLTVNKANIEPFSGWSVAVESLYINGISDVQSLGNGMGLQLYFGGPQVLIPNSINNNSTFPNIIGTVPLNNANLSYPPSYNTDIGGSIWYQNQNTYETRTKMVLRVQDVDSYVLNMVYLNTSGGTSAPDCAFASLTLIFYDDTDGNSFTPPI